MAFATGWSWYSCDMETFEQMPQQWTGIPGDRPSRPSPTWLMFAIVIGMVIGGALVYFLVDTSPESESATAEPAAAVTTTSAPGEAATPTVPLTNGAAIDVAYQTTYPVEGSPNGVVSLIDGSAEIPLSDSASMLMVDVVDAIATDLDGDGVDDAAVILVWSSGGTGSFYSVYGVFADPDQTVVTNEIPIGDRIAIDDFTAGSFPGEIRIRYRDHSEAAGFTGEPDLNVVSEIQLLRTGAAEVGRGSIAVADATNPELTEASTITTGGLGPVRIGMTVDEATKAAGRIVVAPTAAAMTASPGCAFARVEGLPGVGLMLNDGVIGRVDISSGPISTSSGAHIGSTEQEIKTLFPGIITVTDHAYVDGGHYLTLTPTADTLKDFRVVFETDGQVVTSYRAGKAPQVEWIEGCA